MDRVVNTNGEPLNVGMLGMHAKLWSKRTNQCNVLIALGMRFDDRVAE
jgi:acetolactate synthase-1/2/3 large subunit